MEQNYKDPGLTVVNKNQDLSSNQAHIKTEMKPEPFNLEQFLAVNGKSDCIFPERKAEIKLEKKHELSEELKDEKFFDTQLRLEKRKMQTEKFSADIQKKEKELSEYKKNLMNMTKELTDSRLVAAELKSFLSQSEEKKKSLALNEKNLEAELEKVIKEVGTGSVKSVELEISKLIKDLKREAKRKTINTKHIDEVNTKLNEKTDCLKQLNSKCESITEFMMDISLEFEGNDTLQAKLQKKLLGLQKIFKENENLKVQEEDQFDDFSSPIKLSDLGVSPSISPSVQISSPANSCEMNTSVTCAESENHREGLSGSYAPVLQLEMNGTCVPDSPSKNIHNNSHSAITSSLDSEQLQESHHKEKIVTNYLLKDGLSNILQEPYISDIDLDYLCANGLDQMKKDLGLQNKHFSPVLPLPPTPPSKRHKLQSSHELNFNTVSQDPGDKNCNSASNFVATNASSSHVTGFKEDVQSNRSFLSCSSSSKQLLESEKTNCSKRVSDCPNEQKRVKFWVRPLESDGREIRFNNDKPVTLQFNPNNCMMSCVFQSPTKVTDTNSLCQCDNCVYDFVNPKRSMNIEKSHCQGSISSQNINPKNQVAEDLVMNNDSATPVFPLNRQDKALLSDDYTSAQSNVDIKMSDAIQSAKLDKLAADELVTSSSDVCASRRPRRKFLKKRKLKSLKKSENLSRGKNFVIETSSTGKKNKNYKLKDNNVMNSKNISSETNFVRQEPFIKQCSNVSAENNIHKARKVNKTHKASLKHVKDTYLVKNATPKNSVKPVSPSSSKSSSTNNTSVCDADPLVTTTNENSTTLTEDNSHDSINNDINKNISDSSLKITGAELRVNEHKLQATTNESAEAKDSPIVDLADSGIELDTDSNIIQCQNIFISKDNESVSGHKHNTKTESASTLQSGVTEKTRSADSFLFENCVKKSLKLQVHSSKPEESVSVNNENQLVSNDNSSKPNKNDSATSESQLVSDSVQEDIDPRVTESLEENILCNTFDKLQSEQISSNSFPLADTLDASNFKDTNEMNNEEDNKIINKSLNLQVNSSKPGDSVTTNNKNQLVNADYLSKPNKTVSANNESQLMSDNKVEGIEVCNSSIIENLKEEAPNNTFELQSKQISSHPADILDTSKFADTNAIINEVDNSVNKCLILQVESSEPEESVSTSDENELVIDENPSTLNKNISANDENHFLSGDKQVVVEVHNSSIIENSSEVLSDEHSTNTSESNSSSSDAKKQTFKVLDKDIQKDTNEFQTKRMLDHDLNLTPKNKKLRTFGMNKMKLILQKKILSKKLSPIAMKDVISTNNVIDNSTDEVKQNLQSRIVVDQTATSKTEVSSSNDLKLQNLKEVLNNDHSEQIQEEKLLLSNQTTSLASEAPKDEKMQNSKQQSENKDLGKRLSIENAVSAIDEDFAPKNLISSNSQNGRSRSCSGEQLNANHSSSATVNRKEKAITNVVSSVKRIPKKKGLGKNVKKKDPLSKKTAKSSQKQKFDDVKIYEKNSYPFDAACNGLEEQKLSNSHSKLCAINENGEFQRKGSSLENAVSNIGKDLVSNPLSGSNIQNCETSSHSDPTFCETDDADINCGEKLNADHPTSATSNIKETTTDVISSIKKVAKKKTLQKKVKKKDSLLKKKQNVKTTKTSQKQKFDDVKKSEKNIHPFEAAFNGLEEMKFSDSHSKLHVHNLVNVLINPSYPPHIENILFYLSKYLLGSRRNPLLTYSLTHDKRVLMPCIEKCIVNALVQMSFKRKSYLQGLLKCISGTMFYVILLKGKPSEYGLSSCCRVFTDICKTMKDKRSPLLLCCKLLKNNHPYSPFLIATVVGIWPELFQVNSSSSGILSSTTTPLLTQYLKQRRVKRAIEKLFLSYLFLIMSDRKPSNQLTEVQWKQCSSVFSDFHDKSFNPMAEETVEILKKHIEVMKNEGVLDEKSLIVTSLFVILTIQNGPHWTKENILDSFILPSLTKYSQEISNETVFNFFCYLYIDICCVCPKEIYKEKFLLNLLAKSERHLKQDPTCAKFDFHYVAPTIRCALVKHKTLTKEIIPMCVVNWIKQNEPVKENFEIQDICLLIWQKRLSSRNDDVSFEDCSYLKQHLLSSNVLRDL